MTYGYVGERHDYQREVDPIATIAKEISAARLTIALLRSQLITARRCG